MEPNNNNLGAYFGSEVDSEHADIIAIQHINMKLTKREPELMATKWFDYRRLHPTVATYLFTSEYIKAYKQMLRTAFDTNRAAYSKGIKEQDFVNSKEKTAIWKLRQRVDETGIRYDFFIRECMNYCIDQGWRQPPRPSHLYSNDDMMIHVLNLWHEECKGRIQYATDDHYQTENWTGSRDQLAYENWLVDEINKRPRPAYTLSAAIYEMGVLRIETALERFPVATVQEAIRFATPA